MSNETTAVAQRLWNPVRMQRWMLSDLNPMMAPVKAMAASVRANRRPAPPDNPFSRVERAASKQIEEALDQYRDTRDELTERVFKAIYESPWLAPSVGVDAKGRGHGAAASATWELEELKRLKRNEIEGFMEQGTLLDAWARRSSMCDTRAIPPTSARSTCFSR